MHTLFDFVTHIKGIEYLASLTFIALYLIFAEFLKAKPFHTVAQTGQEDIEAMKMEGSGEVFKTIKRIIAAPFLGLAYIVILPFAFVFALVATAVKAISGFAGREIAFGWRPSEAYLGGKKEEKKEKGKQKETEKQA